jgi:hypothetical protein
MGRSWRRPEWRRMPNLEGGWEVKEKARVKEEEMQEEKVEEEEGVEEEERVEGGGSGGRAGGEKEERMEEMCGRRGGIRVGIRVILRRYNFILKIFSSEVVSTRKTILPIHDAILCRARHSPPCFSMCPAHPERPLLTGDGLGAPNTIGTRD